MVVFELENYAAVVQKALIVEESSEHYDKYREGRKRKVDNADIEHKGSKFIKVNQFNKMKGEDIMKRNKDET